MLKTIEHGKDHSVNTSHPPSETSAYYARNEALLNDMYDRAKNRDPPSSDNSHTELGGPLLNYISIKEPQHQSSKVKMQQKSKYRLKTDMCEVDSGEEIEELKLEN